MYPSNVQKHLYLKSESFCNVFYEILKSPIISWMKISFAWLSDTLVKPVTGRLVKLKQYQKSEWKENETLLFSQLYLIYKKVSIFYQHWRYHLATVHLAHHQQNCLLRSYFWKKTCIFKEDVPAHSEYLQYCIFIFYRYAHHYQTLISNIEFTILAF